MTTQDFEMLVGDYIKDPNCPPYLWISYETPNESERQKFVNDERVKQARKDAILELVKR